MRKPRCQQRCETPRLFCDLGTDGRHACIGDEEHRTLHRCSCGFVWDENAVHGTNELCGNGEHVIPHKGCILR